MIISDREKDAIEMPLVSDISTLLLSKARFGVKMKELFWKCVYSTTKEELIESLAVMHQERPECALYTDNIDHCAWTTYAFPGRRYGHVTSNLAEIANCRSHML